MKNVTLNGYMLTGDIFEALLREQDHMVARAMAGLTAGGDFLPTSPCGSDVQDCFIAAGVFLDAVKEPDLRARIGDIAVKQAGIFIFG